MITDYENLEVSEPVEFLENGSMVEEAVNEIKDVISKLKSEFEANSNLVSLAAPQIGINKRIFAMRFADNIKVFINPVLKKKAKYTVIPETFNGINDREYLVTRPSEIFVVYYTEEFKLEDNKLEGLAAYIFDQMNQLLDGILPSDIGLESIPSEDGSLFDLSDEDYAEIVEVYKKWSKIKSDAIKNSLDNEEDKKQLKYLKFTENVINGDSVIVDEEGWRREKAITRQNNINAKNARKASFRNFSGKKCKR